MALVVADRVQETTTTTGTGTYTLAGAKDGFQSFAAVGNSNTTYYACTDGTDYEVGIGTYTSSGTTLARTTIIESSNSDAAVNWGAGSKDIFVTLPASKAVVLDASGDLTLTGASYNAVWDKSDNALEFADNAKAVFGAGSDLQIYHDGSNSYVDDAGTGRLYLRGNDRVQIQKYTGEDMVTAIADGAVNLYYDNAKKLETTSSGVTVTGTIFGDALDIDNIAINGGTITAQAGSMTLSGNVDVSNGLDVTGNITVSGTVDGRDVATDGTKLDGIEASADVTDATNVAAAGAAMTTGATFTGDVTFDGATAGYDIVFDRSDNALEFADNAKAVFGAGSDLQIYHDGSNSYIKEGGTGDLRLQAAHLYIQNTFGQGMIDAQEGGAVNLYHNTSLKLGTTSNGINITGTVTDDGATHDGDVTFTGASYNVLWDKSQNSLEFADNARATFGTSRDLHIIHDGVSQIQNYTGNLTIVNYADDADVKIQTDTGDGNVTNYFIADGSTGEVQLYHYGSEKLATKSTGIDVTGNATFADDGKAIFGAGSDLQIYHDGTHSRIVDAGTGNLSLQGNDLRIKNADASKTYISATNGGALDIRHNDSIKLTTTSTGIDVTGTVTDDGATHDGDVTFTGASYNAVWDKSDNALEFADNAKAIFGAGSDLQIYHDGSNSYIKDAGQGDLSIQTNGSEIAVWNSTDSEYMARFVTGGTATLYYDGSAKLATTSTGINVTGNATFADSGKAIFGAGSDLEIYHDGSNSYVKENGTGNLLITSNGNSVQIQGKAGEDGLTVNADGAVQAYFNNALKLATTSTGIDVTGNITVSGTVDGRDIATNIPSSLGTAGQVLTVNAGATAGEWADVSASANDDIFWENGQTVSSNYTITNGKNAMSAGPITIASGVTVTVGDGEAWTVV